MRVGKIYDADLLNLIKQHNGIKVSELRKLFMVSEPKGVSYGRNRMFESNLAILESEGYIDIKDDCVYRHM